MSAARLLGLVLLGIVETIRETLPSTEDEAGVFLAGMCWAFGLGLAVLIAVSILHCRSVGGC